LDAIFTINTTQCGKTAGITAQVCLLAFSVSKLYYLKDGMDIPKYVPHFSKNLSGTK
jgi:hypothetical protein